eukprot:2534117-Prymnesium_polylepis.1
MRSFTYLAGRRARARALRRALRVGDTISSEPASRDGGGRFGIRTPAVPAISCSYEACPCESLDSRETVAPRSLPA